MSLRQRIVLRVLALLFVTSANGQQEKLGDTPPTKKGAKSTADTLATVEGELRALSSYGLKSIDLTVDSDTRERLGRLANALDDVATLVERNEGITSCDNAGTYTVEGELTFLAPHIIRCSTVLFKKGAQIRVGSGSTLYIASDTLRVDCDDNDAECAATIDGTGESGGQGTKGFTPPPLVLSSQEEFESLRSSCKGGTNLSDQGGAGGQGAPGGPGAIVILKTGPKPERLRIFAEGGGGRKGRTGRRRPAGLDGWMRRTSSVLPLCVW